MARPLLWLASPMKTPDLIDRISPAVEPELPVRIHQSWHHLLFLHWEVPAAEIQKLLPNGLEVDTFDGLAYVGLVPFTVTGTRPVGLPSIPPISDFREVNVRTYVHRAGKDPGVWFFSLDVSSWVAVEAARLVSHLDYFQSKIDVEIGPGPLPRIDFESHRTDERGQKPASCSVRYGAVEGPVGTATPGTIEHFLVERYVLYAARGQQLFRGRVHHAAYPIQHAELDRLDETLIWASGIRRSDAVPMRHYAATMDVKIYPLEQIS